MHRGAGEELVTHIKAHRGSRSAAGGLNAIAMGFRAAVLEVRIQSPPAASLQTIGSSRAGGAAAVPRVIRRVWIGAHERVIHDIIAGIDLAVDLALVVIPDPSAPPREHRFDAQEVFHLPRLENPPLRVDQRKPVAAELEAGREIGGIEHSAS